MHYKKIKTTLISFILLSSYLLLTSLAQGQVTLQVEDSSGFVGSTNNSISVVLNNPSEKVSAVAVDICDVDDFLSCSTCESTTRSSGFSCLATELENGCMHVVLVDFVENTLIEEGNGPIFTIFCDVLPSAPSGECRELNPENENIANELQLPLDVASASGNFCFFDSDTDADGLPDYQDNCPEHPNGPNLGTCVRIVGGVFLGVGTPCIENVDCAGNETCDLAQLDHDESGVGDACECRGNFDGDDDIDGTDAAIFKVGFGRLTFDNPCPSNQ